MEYQAKYKCRLCGEEYAGAVTGNKDLAFKIMMDISILGKSKEIQSPNLIDIHQCDNGGFGISDFHGFDTK